MVITLDFESSNPGSNPGRTSFGIFSFFFFEIKKKKCLEWGSNPRLHRRIELKSTALDHSAIEALVGEINFYYINKKMGAKHLFEKIIRALRSPV